MPVAGRGLIHVEFAEFLLELIAAFQLAGVLELSCRLTEEVAPQGVAVVTPGVELDERAALRTQLASSIVDDRALADAPGAVEAEREGRFGRKKRLGDDGRVVAMPKGVARVVEPILRLTTPKNRTDLR